MISGIIETSGIKLAGIGGLAGLAESARLAELVGSREVTILLGIYVINELAMG